MRNYVPQYGWEDTYVDGFIEYDGNEYGSRRVRRNDEVDFTVPLESYPAVRTQFESENLLHFGWKIQSYAQPTLLKVKVHGSDP